MTSPLPSPSEVYRLLGERIRSERKHRKLTQDELAQRIGLERTSITNIEKGRQKLLVHTLVQMAAALDVSPRDLLAPLEKDSRLSLAESLPPNLTASAKDWILSGVATSKQSTHDERHSPKAHKGTR